MVCPLAIWWEYSYLSYSLAQKDSSIVCVQLKVLAHLCPFASCLIGLLLPTSPKPHCQKKHLYTICMPFFKIAPKHFDNQTLKKTSLLFFFCTFMINYTHLHVPFTLTTKHLFTKEWAIFFIFSKFTLTNQTQKSRILCQVLE